MEWTFTPFGELHDNLDYLEIRGHANQGDKRILCRASREYVSDNIGPANLDHANDLTQEGYDLLIERWLTKIKLNQITEFNEMHCVTLFNVNDA